MNIRGRRPRYSESTERLFEMLKDAVRNPSAYVDDNDFISALKTQGKLSKYSSLVHKIEPSSINTLKRVCSKEIEGGFSAFDSARLAALESVQEHLARRNKANKTTKEGLRLKLRELENLLLTSQRNNWQLTMAFQRSLQQGRYYAEKTNDSSVIELCRREQQELLKLFSLLARPFVEPEK